MSGQHTPGPWFFREAVTGIPSFGGDGCFEILDRENAQQANVLCTRHPWPEKKEEMVANARLIAAAPELLEALEACIGPATHLYHTTDDADGSIWEAVIKARAALAKANATASTTDAGVVG